MRSEEGSALLPLGHRRITRAEASARVAVAAWELTGTLLDFIARHQTKARQP